MIHDLTRILIDDAWEHGSLRALLARVCPVLAAHGVPVCRVSLGLETLHPEASGSQLVWRDGQMEQHDSARADHLTGSRYIKSPTKVVDDTGRPFRWRAGEPDVGMPMLAELQAEGVTDSSSCRCRSSTPRGRRRCRSRRGRRAGSHPPPRPGSSRARG